MTEEDLKEHRRKLEEVFKEIQKEEDFPIPWRKVTPEEYVARQWHCIECCSLHLYTYDDDALNDWIARFAKIIASDELVEHARKSVLSSSEYNLVQKEMRLIKVHGLT